MGCVFVILDGLGDRAYECLGGKTPLQAARTPWLDRLASIAGNGMMHAAANGQALTSENAHFALFGYDARDFPGRGYLEAIGAGIALDPQDVAILARLVYTSCEDGLLKLEKNWPKADSAEITELIGSISPFECEGVNIEYIKTSGTSGILVMRGPVSRFITDSNPLTEGSRLIEPQPWEIGEGNPASALGARVLGKYLRWCYHRLENHPVNTARQQQGGIPLNMLVTNRAGQYVKIDPFEAKWGLKALSISSGLIYHGLCRFVGFDVLPVADSASPGDDLAGRLEAALSSLGKYDFIHVHTKAPDVAAHTKNPLEKKRVIEELDLGIGQVFDRLTADADHLIIITADHSTPSSEPLIHSGEPVPFMAFGRGVRQDNVCCFNEVDCAGGALGFIRGEELMYFVLNGLDRIKLSGLMDTPCPQPYWPGKRQNFNINIDL